MLFVEFIAPVKKFTQAIRCLCALYYLKHNLNIEIATVSQLKNLLKRARVIDKNKKINYSRALESLEEQVDSPAKGMWQITSSGERSVRSLLNIPDNQIEALNDVLILENLVTTKITDLDTKEYLEEGIDCLKIDRLRACVVFLWSGAVHLIRANLILQNYQQLNTAIKKHDPKARDVRKVEDFAYIKDSIAILAMNDLGLCDKSQKDILEDCLDLRNKCGHPGKYNPGPKKVSAFIEDLVKVVF